MLWRPTGTDAATHPTPDDVVDGVRAGRSPRTPRTWTVRARPGGLDTRHGPRAAAGRAHPLRGWRPDVVHAHDWLVTHPAIALADRRRAARGDVPRHRGRAAFAAGCPALNRQVHSVEWWLANRADAVITCSAAMRAEVAELFEVPSEESRWRTTASRRGDGGCDEPAPVPRQSRRRAAAAVLRQAGVGKGTGASSRPSRAFGGRTRAPGSWSRARAGGADARRDRPGPDAPWTSWAPGRLPLGRAVAAADAVVLPSRYEPFGIVALEAAAAGAPLVASTAGGLGELVIDGETGMSFPPGDVPALAAAVGRVLADPRGGPAGPRGPGPAGRRLRLGPDRRGDHGGLPAGQGVPSAGIQRPKIATGNAFEP